MRMATVLPSTELVKKVRANGLTSALLKRLVRQASRYVRFPHQSAVTVVVVGDREMRRLNKHYRAIPTVTDVLSFAYSPTSADIIICYPQAKRQAKKKQQSVQQECALLITHGILHWLGFDHETAAEAKVMRPLERKILYG